jgi:hypothetical protein
LIVAHDRRNESGRFPDSTYLLYPQGSDRKSEAMKEIPLSNSELKAIVDDDEYERVSSHKWWINGSGYASSWIDKKDCFMHRFIMGAKKGQEIDHLNSSKLDNRKENLRFCTHLQNVLRIGVRKNSTTGFVGVSYDKTNKNFRAYVRVQGCQLFLGKYKTAKEAAVAYNKGAEKHFGEHAYQNTVETI